MEPTKITCESTFKKGSCELLNNSLPIYKSSCWSCKRAWEDPEQKYRCPKMEQHLSEYEQWIKERDNERYKKSWIKSVNTASNQ